MCYNSISIIIDILKRSDLVEIEYVSALEDLSMIEYKFKEVSNYFYDVYNKNISKNRKI